MLLSFQNDYSRPLTRATTVPKVNSGPTLSFGLFFVGQDYNELELLLDGQEGRPTLEQLKAQEKTHVVATYNVATGLKALYINGKLMVSHQYPPGTKMLSGGPGKATIGNSPHNHEEAFSGIIDEVAFYDFALTPFMINYHHELSTDNKNYFDLNEIDTLPDSLEIKLPQSVKITIDPHTGLPVTEISE